MTMWAGAVLGSVAFKACSITRSCVIRYCTGRHGEEEEDVVCEAKRNHQQYMMTCMAESTARKKGLPQAAAASPLAAEPAQL